MKEVINFYRNEINESKILINYLLKKENFILVSLHREENVDNEMNIKNIFLS